MTKTRKKKEPTNGTWEDVAQYYERGHSLIECEKRFNLSIGTIRTRLIKMGVEMRKQGVRLDSKQYYERSAFLFPREKGKKRSPHPRNPVSPSSDGDTPPRKIIKLNENDQLRYEKEV